MRFNRSSWSVPLRRLSIWVEIKKQTKFPWSHTRDAVSLSRTFPLVVCSHYTSVCVCIYTNTPFSTLHILLPHYLLLFEADREVRKWLWKHKMYLFFFFLFFFFIFLRKTTESLFYKRKYTYFIFFVETETGFSEQIFIVISVLFVCFFTVFRSFDSSLHRFRRCRNDTTTTAIGKRWSSGEINFAFVVRVRRLNRPK